MTILCVGKVQGIVGDDGASGSPLPGVGQYQLVLNWVGFPSGAPSFTASSRIVANQGSSKAALKTAAEAQIKSDAETNFGLTFGSGDTVQILDV